MGKGKNQRRKTRLLEISQLGDMDRIEHKIAFINEIGNQWGRKPIFKKNRREDGTCEVTCGFAKMPFSVIGVKGEGSSFDAAEANLAFNFLSFLQNGYLSDASIKLIRTKWCHARDEISEVVNVFKFIDKVLNTEIYSELLITKNENTGEMKSLARSLKTKVKFALKRRDYGVMQTPSTSNDLKRRAGYLEGDTKPKKGKTDIGEIMVIGADDDEIICLDDTGDLSLNVSDPVVESGKPKNTFKGWPKIIPTDIYGGHNSLQEWCAENKLPIDFERTLIGVEYSGIIGIEEKVKVYLEKYNDDAIALEKNIWNHYELNGQNDEVYAWKMKVRSMLLAQFSQLFPRNNIQMFAVGSTVNGCGSYNSDMDLCLCIPREGTNDDFALDRTMSIKALRKINSVMNSKPSLKKLIKKSEFVPAKVPIVKVEMHPPYQELDLDINVNNVAGIYNSHLIHYYSRIDARFPALALLIKHWAITNNINDPMNGTLNSYSLILLVLHYLQCGVRPAVLPNLQYLFPKRFAEMPPLSDLNLYQELLGLPERPMNAANVAELLVGFFHYFKSFDFTTYAISIRNGKRFARSSMPLETSHYQMYIEEPFDGKNTARCVTKPHSMHAIRTAINRSFRQFSEKRPLLASINVKI